MLAGAKVSVTPVPYERRRRPSDAYKRSPPQGGVHRLHSVVDEPLGGEVRIGFEKWLAGVERHRPGYAHTAPEALVTSGEDGRGQGRSGRSDWIGRGGRAKGQGASMTLALKETTALYRQASDRPPRGVLPSPGAGREPLLRRSPGALDLDLGLVERLVGMRGLLSPRGPLRPSGLPRCRAIWL
jgi:hypothetical protein